MGELVGSVNLSQQPEVGLTKVVPAQLRVELGSRTDIIRRP